MKKPLLYSIAIFIITTILITTWYVMDVGDTIPEIGAASIKNVVVKFGFYGATMCTILFLMGYFIVTKIKNKWLMTIALLVLLVLLYFAFGWFLWYVGINGLVDNPISE